MASGSVEDGVAVLEATSKVGMSLSISVSNALHFVCPVFHSLVARQVRVSFIPHHQPQPSKGILRDAMVGNRPYHVSVPRGVSLRGKVCPYPLISSIVSMSEFSILTKKTVSLTTCARTRKDLSMPKTKRRRLPSELTSATMSTSKLMLDCIARAASTSGLHEVGGIHSSIFVAEVQAGVLSERTFDERRRPA